MSVFAEGLCSLFPHRPEGYLAGQCCLSRPAFAQDEQGPSVFVVCGLQRPGGQVGDDDAIQDNGDGDVVLPGPIRLSLLEVSSGGFEVSVDPCIQDMAVVMEEADEEDLPSGDFQLPQPSGQFEIDVRF